MSYETSLLVLNQRGDALALKSDSAYRLPTVRLESGRVGIALSRAVRTQLGLEVFLLILPGAAEDSIPTLRLQTDAAATPPGYFWIPPSEIVEPVPLPPHIFRAFSSADREVGRYGWYSEVQGWLGREVTRMGHNLRSLEQWNGRVGGVLLRVTTDGPHFWFKAVSGFNVREIWIAQMLAERHPACFPRILATESAWNAFLLEHVEGTELYESYDLATWERVARLLADVQMDWLGRDDDLLHGGAVDLRPESLRVKMPGFLTHVAAAMARQPKTPPAVLMEKDLDHLQVALHALCYEVASLPFASGLANADFSPHNTLITSRGPMFIDWAEACVSFPLIAGEYMWNRMAVESPSRQRWQDALRGVYLNHWAQEYGCDKVNRAATLLPAFALLAVAMFYHEREDPRSSPYDSYLRSLTRKLVREVTSLQSPTEKNFEVTHV